MGKTEKQRVRIYSALEVANMCGVVNQTAINWIRSGHLKAFTTPGGQYRVYAEDLVRFLRERSMRIPAELDSSIKVDVDRNLVLVVDDDKDLNTILKRMIERRFPDLRVIQAYDGFEAGKLMVERHPYLVLLDIDLPGIDGRMLCRRVKSDPSFGKPAILAMSGMDRAEVQDLIMAEGADDFYAKPLDFESILNRADDLRTPPEVQVEADATLAQGDTK